VLHTALWLKIDLPNVYEKKFSADGLDLTFKAFGHCKQCVTLMTVWGFILPQFKPQILNYNEIRT